MWAADEEEEKKKKGGLFRLTSKRRSRNFAQGTFEADS